MCIMEQLPSSKQILMFSATIPDWVGSMAKRLMKKDSITVVVGEVRRTIGVEGKE